MLYLKDLLTEVKPLSKGEIAKLKKKLKAPVLRDPKKGLKGIQKHWSKMSKAERMHLDRLARGEGTSGSREMK